MMDDPVWQEMWEQVEKKNRTALMMVVMGQMAKRYYDQYASQRNRLYDKWIEDYSLKYGGEV